MKFRALDTFEQGMPRHLGGVFKLHKNRTYEAVLVAATDDVPAHYLLTIPLATGKTVVRSVPKTLMQSFVTGRLLEILPDDQAAA